jgi:hypothetical protein
VELRDFSRDLESYIPIRTWYESFFDFQEYFDFLGAKKAFDGIIDVRKTYKEHFELEYEYLLTKFTPFRTLIDSVDYHVKNAAKYYSYLQRQKDTKKLAFDLLIDWATQKHYNPKSLLLVLNDREFYYFLEDHSYLEMDSNLRLQAQKWFEHFNKSKWYHYLNSEDEILMFYGEKGLEEHRKALANLNSIATWSFDYTM